MKTLTYTKNIQRLAKYIAFYTDRYANETAFILRKQYARKIFMYTKLHTTLTDSYSQAIEG